MIALPRSPSGVVALTARWCLAAFFIIAGYFKALSPAAFLMDVRSFQLLDDPWAAWLAMSLPWLEILCGLALVSGILLDGAILTITGMLSAFLAAIIYSWHRGIDLQCGCFGENPDVSNYRELITRDVLLLATAIALLVYRWHLSRQSPPPATPTPESPA